MDGGDAGGIARAAALLAEHGGAVEADLQRFYGIHVGDFPFPLTARRLLVLLEELPEDAALWRSLSPDAAHWHLDRQLLASVVDELRGVQYYIAAAAGAKGLKPPARVPRPGVGEKRAVSPPTAAAVRARLAERGIHVPEELLMRERR